MTDATPTTWFVGGSVRSGSTLLAGLLAAATGGFDAGELHLLWRSLRDGRLCTCRLPMTECPVWSGVSDAVLADPGVVASGITDVGTAAGAEAAEPTLRQVAAHGRRTPVNMSAQTLRTATETALRAVVGPVLIDSSKVAGTALLADRAAAADGGPLRLVHLVRDPRAVAYSALHPKPDPSMGGAPMPSRSAASAALVWSTYNLAFERLRGLSPRRVRYEDLVAGPPALLADLGAGALPRVSDDSEPGHAIAGNPWRFDPDAAAGGVRADERWRTGLGPRDRWAVVALTAPLMLRYGYRR